MKQAGIPQKDWEHVDYVIQNESGWNHTVWNKQGSNAYGLGQALPPTKMAVAGEDYMTNPVTQLKWADQYAKNRYGNWAQAASIWASQKWW